MIFVDTSFWVATGMARDERHGAAVKLLGSTDDTPLVTTNLVRGETWTFLRRRSGHRAAVDFLDRLEHSPRVRVARVSEQVEEQALSWLRRRDDREYSFVDATSFGFMWAAEMLTVLTFDEDFAATGFQVLRH